MSRDIVYMANRLEMNGILEHMKHGDRIFARGAWHTIRSIGFPLRSLPGDISVGFEDGGGCDRGAITALVKGRLVFALCAPGWLPQDTGGA
jgi:hypothetical protein